MGPTHDLTPLIDLVAEPGTGPRRERRPVSEVYSDIEGFDDLSELALDVRWSWNHGADHIWRELDGESWALTHSPWVVLQSVARERIGQLMADTAFRGSVRTLLEARREAEQARAWFQESHAGSPLTAVAYFSMEFMLTEALPIYSGGLGNVAGDQLKAAGDLGVPVVGVGLLYSQGYFRQMLDQEGRQKALFPYNDPGQLPIRPLRGAGGEWLRFQLKLPGHPIWVRTWEVRVGRSRLYLLDSNDAANFPAYRGITGELYGGGSEMRLQQELLLGIGGWRLLGLLGIQPEVCHLNEGHAAFAVLERARSFMKETGQPFEAALVATRAGNLFTTHTAVAAGFDRFEPELIGRYLGGYAERELGISSEALLALGRIHPEDADERFSMTQLALRGSGHINGVSRLHGAVSRQIFAPAFPRWPTDEIPIRHVTNGVHVPSWDSAAADELWTRACGRACWLRSPESLQRDLSALGDEALWSFRNASRAALVEHSRERLAQQLTASGADAGAVDAARHILDPQVLTVGFARRFAAYKRPNLLLHDPQRLLRLLANPGRPMQLIIAGKAHPADEPGQALIAEWTHFMRHTEARQHAIFLADYDMLLTERLVQGVDLWLNTPRRPWEACGTSGMKGLVNGVINLSELDGWWAEAYAPDVGWALGDGGEHGEDPSWDAKEADALYALLEREVVPQFYEREPDGVPRAWVARMRQSMQRLTPQYSSIRSLHEYVEQHYLPAALRYRERSAAKGEKARQIAEWLSRLQRSWAELRFGPVTVETRAGQHRFEILLHLGSLDPESVRVELYGDAPDGGAAERHAAIRVRALSDRPGTHLYSVDVPATRRADDYTARAVPHHDGVSVPQEARQILWQR
ncbi:MAG: alpha-glucan family phosphorylase [Steroidobacteraceae bacterium]